MKLLEGRRRVAAVLILPLLGLGAVAGAVVIVADSDVRPLSKADSWRDGLWEGFESRGEEPPYALIEIAYDRAAAERAWAENVPPGLPERSGRPDADGRYGELDDVDFSRQAVVVWSSGQSGTCPGWLADVRTVDGVVQVTTDQRGSACTDDYRTYRMVLAVSRDRLPEQGELPTTEVLVDGRDLHWGSQVRAYPPTSAS